MTVRFALTMGRLLQLLSPRPQAAALLPHTASHAVCAAFAAACEHKHKFLSFAGLQPLMVLLWVLPAWPLSRLSAWQWRLPWWCTRGLWLWAWQRT